MSDPTPEQVRASIVPKSDQLNADDLLTGPITVTIESVSRGDKDQPIVVGISGHRPYKPCKSMRRVLIAAFSDDPKKWVGQRMTLFCDPEVMWAGVKVGGIRISHLSGLEHPRTFLLTQARGKRAEFTIRPLEKVEPNLSAEDAEFIAAATEEIKAAENVDVLKGYGQLLRDKSAAIQDALRPLYAERKKALTETE